MLNSSNPFQRNEEGLLPNVSYVKKSDGKIDWRKMIEPDCFVPNRDKTSETDISKIEDKDLLILLRGFKEVAKLRGYTKVKTRVRPVSSEFIAAETLITWIPNFETGESITTSGTGDATVHNTSGFGSLFLTTIAENRSFVRCVRNFLDIPILGQDELGGNAESAKSDIDEHTFLENLLKENNIKFESFKNKMIRQKFEGADGWQELSDVPKNRIFEAIEIVKALLAAKKSQASK